tara:strand:- start:1810 stop:2547 length:738 start_codon:yes stop_codon:yes gene_type:complete
MCFSEGASLGMAILGGLSSIAIYKYINFKAAFCIFYFTLMQIIHYIGYQVIDECNDKTNQLMSILNYYHICFQAPVWLIGWLGVFEKFKIIKPLYLKFMPILISMALITSILMGLRRFDWPGNIPNEHKTILEKSKVNDDINEALQGKLCSTTGKHHIKFRLPLRSEPSYYTPNLFGHFLFFFVPLLLFNNTTRIIAILTWLFGLLIPTVYLQIETSESSTVWCFLSIIQLTIMYGYLIFKSKRH